MTPDPENPGKGPEAPENPSEPSLPSAGEAADEAAKLATKRNPEAELDDEAANTAKEALEPPEFKDEERPSSVRASMIEQLEGLEDSKFKSFFVQMAKFMEKYGVVIDYVPGSFLDDAPEKKLTEEELEAMKNVDKENEGEREAAALDFLKKYRAHKESRNKKMDPSKASTRFASLTLWENSDYSDPKALAARLKSAQDPVSKNPLYTVCKSTTDFSNASKKGPDNKPSYPYGSVLIFTAGSFGKDLHEIVAFATGEGDLFKYYDSRADKVVHINAGSIARSPLGMLKFRAAFIPRTEEDPAIAQGQSVKKWEKAVDQGTDELKKASQVVELGEIGPTLESLSLLRNIYENLLIEEMAAEIKGMKLEDESNAGVIESSRELLLKTKMMLSEMKELLDSLDGTEIYNESEGRFDTVKMAGEVEEKSVAIAALLEKLPKIES